MVCVHYKLAVADPGFPVGGRGPFRRGRGPPTWVLFGKNGCENERIGSHRGMSPVCPLDLPMAWMLSILCTDLSKPAALVRHDRPIVE